MFYGEGTAELVKLLAKDILQKKVFHGGGNNGYIGTVQHAYDWKEIEQFVNKVIKEYEHV